MRIAIIGSGTAAKTLPPHLASMATEAGAEAVLVNPRLSAFALSAYERLVVDVGYVDAMQSAAAQSADAVLINSFADYGVDAARAATATPVIGAGEATLRAASQDGARPFAIVTVWPASMGFLYEERLRALGLGSLCRGVRHLSPEEELARLGSEDDVMQRMARHDTQVLERLVDACRLAVRHDGAAAIALGCTCMAPIGPALAARLDVPVYESSRTGLHAAIDAARDGVRREPTARYPALIPNIVSAWAGTVEAVANVGVTNTDCPFCITTEDPT